MDTKFNSITESEIIEIIEKNLYENILFQAKGYEVDCDNDHISLLTGFSHPYFNVSFLKNSQKLDATISSFLMPNLSGRVVTGNSFDFESVKSYLEGKGFFYAEDTIGMVLDLQKINTEDLTDYDFFKVDSSSSLDLWLEPISLSYRLKNESKEYARKYYLDLDLNSDRLLHFVCTSNGSPVASASLFLEDDVVGLYNVCTIPEMRNRGIGSFITKQCLKFARDMGYTVAILQSSDMGKSIYKKIGFKEYGKQSVFIFIANR